MLDNGVFIMAKVEQYRFFSLLSYCPEDFIITVLMSHDNISHWAYALHNKDDSEPHFHILIMLRSATSLSAVRKWFAYQDSTGQQVNTLAKKVYRKALNVLEYFVHKGKPDKFQYDESIIKSDDLDYFLSGAADNENLNDCSFSIIDDFLSGVSFREMCKVYGRDFIIHLSSYRLAVEMICQQEGLPLPFNVVRKDVL